MTRLHAIGALQPHMLSLFRMMLGLIYMQHGLSKLFGFPAQAQVFNVFPYQFMMSGVLETFGGALIALGLLTRPVAFLLAGEMALAYFLVHAPRSFYPYLNGGSLAIMYCFGFLYLVTAGGGRWSLDRMFGLEGAAPRQR